MTIVPAHGEASKKLVAQALALGNGAEALVGNALGKELWRGEKVEEEGVGVSVGKKAATRKMWRDKKNG